MRWWRERNAKRSWFDHKGADSRWSPKAALKNADTKPREPEETVAEAADREAEERFRHLADLDRAAEQQTRAEFAEVEKLLNPILAALDKATRNVMAANGYTGAAAETLLTKYRDAEPVSRRLPALTQNTGAWPIVNKGVLADREMAFA